MNKQEALEVFGFSRNSQPTEKDIRKQYMQLSKKYHPDRVDAAKKTEATEAFQKINIANEVLTNKTATNDDIEDDFNFKESNDIDLREIFINEISLNLLKNNLNIPVNIKELSEDQLCSVRDALRVLIERGLQEQDICDRLFQDPEKSTQYAFYISINHLMHQENLTYLNLSLEISNQSLLNICEDLHTINQLNQYNITLMSKHPEHVYSLWNCIKNLVKSNLYSDENKEFVANLINIYPSKLSQLGWGLNGARDVKTREEILIQTKEEFHMLQNREQERILLATLPVTASTIKKHTAIVNDDDVNKSINDFEQKWAWVFNRNPAIRENLKIALKEDLITPEQVALMTKNGPFVINFLFESNNACAALREGLITPESANEYITWSKSSVSQLEGLPALLDRGLDLLRAKLITLDDIKPLIGKTSVNAEIERIEKMLSNNVEKNIASQNKIRDAVNELKSDKKTSEKRNKNDSGQCNIM